MNVWGLSKKILGIGLVAVPLTMTTALTGCLTDEEKDPPADTVKTEYPAAKSLDVGGQGHATLGSALELDTGKVYLSAVANQNLSSVDLVMLYYAGGWHIDNTKSAKAAGATHSINLTNSYPDASVKDNKFVKVTTKPANQEAGKAAFTAGTKLATSTIAANDMFVVETTNGKLVLLTVSSVTGSTNAGAATFSLQIGTLSP